MINAKQAREIHDNIDNKCNEYLDRIDKEIRNIAKSKCNLTFSIGITSTHEIEVQNKLIEILTKPEMGYSVTTGHKEIDNNTDEFFLYISW
jgi:nucleotidyltransferase/DNA polymerase involved in DNA repair